MSVKRTIKIEMESPSVNLLDLVDLLKEKWGKPTSFERNGMAPKRQEAFDEGWKQALGHVLDDLSDVTVMSKGLGVSEPTFPWEDGYDPDRLAKEYAEFHGLDLEETKRKFAELRAKVAQEMDSGIIPCDQIIYEKP